jgi:hypothetical protein
MKGGQFVSGKASVRGQVTFEFIIAIVVVLLLFISGLVIYQSRQSVNLSSFTTWGLENLGNRLARNINTVSLLDENSVLTENLYYSFPNVSISGRENYLIFSGNNILVQIPLVTNKVSFLVSDFNGPIIFKKVNGVVVVGYS